MLVNRPVPETSGNLLGRIEHGDADIELQFMMAGGSNSGLYLQGRYEVQLLDSWGQTRPRYSDCGGGRSFYTGLGHTVESWSSPLMRTQLAGGLAYAAGHRTVD